MSSSAQTLATAALAESLTIKHVSLQATMWMTRWRGRGAMCTVMVTCTRASLQLANVTVLVSTITRYAAHN